MRYTGLTAEILINILFITAVALFLIGIIAIKVNERIALEGNVESVKSLATALEDTYFRQNDIEGGVGFLRKALNLGSSVAIIANDSGILLNRSSGDIISSTTDPLIKEALSSGETAVDIEGVNIPPFSSYKGFKVALPVRLSGGQDGVLFIYQPLSAFEDNMILSQCLIALWIILFLVVIAFFGFYILSRRVIKPVRELINITEKIADGKFPQNTEIGKVKEINQLYSALKVMYEEIEQGKSTLRQKISELEQMNAELQQTQRELIASEKLASLGRLSAGVAHEIGNPLSAISGYVEVLKRTLSTDSGINAGYLEDIEREIERVDNIIKTLLEYSRPIQYEPSVLDANSVIKESIDIVTRQGILKNTALKEDLYGDPLLIEADPHQLSQVIINLILNAKDAADDRGEISIASGMGSENTVFITLSDNGAGISSEILDHIFDPFFTTKEPCKGTGLGLPVSLRIVEAFGGKMTVKSQEGRGTLFTLTFPQVLDYDKAENFSN